MGLTIFGREYGLNPIRNAVNNTSLAASGAGTVARNVGSLAPAGSPLDYFGNILGQERGISEAISFPLTTVKGSTGSQSTDNTGGSGAQQGSSQVDVSSLGSTGSGSGSVNPSILAGAVNSVYDSRNARLNSLLNQIPTQRDQALSQFNNNADVQLGALNNAASTGRANIDFQDQENQNMRQRSYRDIASGIRNTMEASANRLGAMNASDSSASTMLQYALANLQAQQRGQANDTFGSNSAQIGLARNNMENEFTNQMNAFNNEKRNRIQEIADKYSATRAQIVDQMAQSDEARAYELANLGQQYTQRALSDIAGLEQQYNTVAEQWLQSALAGLPQVNTQPFQQTAQTQAYGAYGRGTPVQDNLTSSQVDDAYDSAGLPLRKLKDQYGF